VEELPVVAVPPEQPEMQIANAAQTTSDRCAISLLLFMAIDLMEAFTWINPSAQGMLRMITGNLVGVPEDFELELFGRLALPYLRLA